MDIIARGVLVCVFLLVFLTGREMSEGFAVLGNEKGVLNKQAKGAKYRRHYRAVV